MNKILLIPLLVASFSANAAQVLVGKPDDTLSARVSRADLLLRKRERIELKLANLAIQ